MSASVLLVEDNLNVTKQKLGKGAFATVFLAKHKESNKEYALKRLIKECVF